MSILSSIAETKNNLPKYIHEAESGNDICITRHGKPVAVLVSIERYENNFADDNDNLFSAIMAWRNKLNANDCDLFTDSEIDALRDKNPAREFSWD